MTLPDRLSAAISSYQYRPGTPEHRPATRRGVSRGDIRRVEPCFEPEGPGRFALILNVDSDEESVEIVLVHPYTELATETDLIFAPDETDAPYPVIVQTEIRSAVWTLQTRERVGSLSEEALDEFGRVAVSDDPFAASPRTGPPLAGPADSRWYFKQQEIATLNQLAADRISAVFEDGLNPQWLLLINISKSFDSFSLADELAARPLEWALEDLATLQDREALDPDTWRRQFGSDLGRDLYVSHMQQIDGSLALAAN